jgi:RNA polymerase sigma-70 factor, ECF subfamily
MQIAVQIRTANSVGSDSSDRLEESIHVLRARQGEAEAFNWLMARHERPLLYYIRRLIPRPDDALDVHQEVWLAVFRGLPALRKPQAFRGWLYRLAHDRAVQFIKQEIRESKSKESLDTVSDEASDLRDEDPEILHRALVALSPPHREVLTLHYLRDLSLEEIAVACDAALGTVKSRLHYARVALRRHLERRPNE